MTTDKTLGFPLLSLSVVIRIDVRTPVPRPVPIRHYRPTNEKKREEIKIKKRKIGKMYYTIKYKPLKILFFQFPISLPVNCV
jgi:hypothetical protein